MLSKVIGFTLRYLMFNVGIKISLPEVHSSQFSQRSTNMTQTHDKTVSYKMRHKDITR